MRQLKTLLETPSGNERHMNIIVWRDNRHISMIEQLISVIFKLFRLSSRQFQIFQNISKNKIKIMPGSGINKTNIVNFDSFNEIHGSFKNGI